MYFSTPEEAFGYCILTLVCGYAAWRGGVPERWASTLIFLDWVLTPLVENHDAFRNSQVWVFALDGSLALILLAIALTSNRIWPIWVTAFQILELLMHLAKIIDHKVHARAYFVGIEISSYLMLLALAVGTRFEAPKRSRPSAESV